MIPISDARLYSRSLDSLRSFVAAGYHGRIVQIFLAAKYYGPSIPRVGSGQSISIREFQHKLDDFYHKNSRPDEDGSIAMIFQNNHLVPTGQLGRNITVPANIWRNNLGLQKATICYASETELNDDAFLATPRLACPHLRPAVAGSLVRAKCRLDLRASYRREDGPKAIRRDPVDSGFSLVDPTKIDHWKQIIAPQGERLPIVPLIATLYHDADLASGRSVLEPLDFVRDFGFSAQEYHAYFDDDPAHPVHAALTRGFRGLAWTRVPGSFGTPSTRRGASRGARGPSSVVDPDSLPIVAPRTAPPAGGHWWSAEQGVEKYLKSSGWNVINRSSQSVGFDLEVWRSGESQHRYIEVKSSVGQCAPVMTRKEYEAARRYGQRYILAIVENFDPDDDLAILWVQDPASLPIRGREVLQYAVPRSVWLKSAGIGF